MAKYKLLKNLYIEPAKMLKPGTEISGGLELSYDKLVADGILEALAEPVLRKRKKQTEPEPELETDLSIDLDN